MKKTIFIVSIALLSGLLILMLPQTDKAEKFNDESFFKVLEQCQHYLRRGVPPDDTFRNLLNKYAVSIMTDQGLLIFTKDTKRDGLNILNKKSVDNHYFIREIIQKAKFLNSGEIGSHIYRLGSRNEKSRENLVRFVYFRQWHWVLYVSDYKL